MTILITALSRLAVGAVAWLKNRRHRKRDTLLCLIALSIAQAQGATINVRIGELSELIPLASQPVKLLATSSSTGRQEAVSDETGLVSFADVAAGSYTLSIPGMSCTILVPRSDATLDAIRLLAAPLVIDRQHDAVPIHAQSECGLTREYLSATNAVVDFDCETVNFAPTTDVNFTRSMNRSPEGSYRVARFVFSTPTIVSWPPSWSVTNSVTVAEGEIARITFLSFGPSKTIASWMIE